jgi:hypothetical protein
MQRLSIPVLSEAEMSTASPGIVQAISTRLVEMWDTPLLDDIRSKIEAAQSVALPSSALSKACQYALALWKKLTRFLEHPELELSTNLAENFMVPWHWVENTGSTSAVHRRVLRLRRFSRSWKAAAG